MFWWNHTLDIRVTTLCSIDIISFIMRRTWLKIGDRIRIFGCIQRISIDAILPIIILPIGLGLAAINFYFLIGICILMPLLLGFVQWHRKMLAPRTKFFFMWTLASGIYLWCLFEITVPVMELLPEENFIFITSMFGAAYCFYKVSNKYLKCTKKISKKKRKQDGNTPFHRKYVYF